MKRVLLAAVAAPLLSGCILASMARPAPLPEGAREEKGIAYWAGEGFDDEKHRLDVYAPAGPGPHPVVLFVHGGGWRLGDRDFFGAYKNLGRRLASRGMVAVVTSYRLAPDHKHPAHVRDVARAIAWTFAHAESYGGDPARVFVMGHSAGAHLVALAACDPRWLAEQGLEPSRLAGVIGISGPYDVHGLGRSRVVGGVPMVIPAFGEEEEGWRDASPARHLAPGRAPPPFLVAVGDSDPELLQRHAEAFAAQLRAAGGKVATFTASLKDHFTVITDLAEPGDELGDAVQAFVASTAPAPLPTAATRP